MRTISLWQPWASLWLNGVKIHETRGWSTNYRGHLAVHAAKRRIDKVLAPDLEAICLSKFGPNWRQTLPVGSLIGFLTLIDCIPSIAVDRRFSTVEDFACGNFEPNRFAWRASTFRSALSSPVPYVGRQGFFSVPDELMREAA